MRFSSGLFDGDHLHAKLCSALRQRVSHSTLPQRSSTAFLRRDLRQRADYFANPSIERRLRAGFAALKPPLVSNVRPGEQRR